MHIISQRVDNLFLQAIFRALCAIVGVAVGKEEHNHLSVTRLPVATCIYGFCAKERFELPPEWTL
jgi:hypothetical protein